MSNLPTRVYFSGVPLTLANRITIIRILSVPIFVLLLVYYEASVVRGQAVAALRWAAVLFFLATVITDAVDGFLARKRKEITRIGAVLDPLADKALLLSALILLSRPSSAGFALVVPVWFTILCVSRDIVVVLGAAVVHFVTGDVVLRPRWSGKATTFFQTVFIIAVLLDIDRLVVFPLLGLAAAATASSAAQYVWDGIAQLDKNQKASNA